MYSQAIMDLGAIICKKKNPNCSSCPQNKNCLAYKHDLTELIPAKVKKKEKPRKMERISKRISQEVQVKTRMINIPRCMGSFDQYT